jgi:hypothetical protein
MKSARGIRTCPEDLGEVISAYQKCVAETVRRFEGFVAKYLGDGVLVYFGYPQAHEDDAERAVRAGLELIPSVAVLKAPEPPRHCHWSRPGRRPDRIGRSAGAWHRRRDAESCCAAAGNCRAEYGSHHREHTKAPRKSLRSSRTRRTNLKSLTRFFRSPPGPGRAMFITVRVGAECGDQH